MLIFFEIMRLFTTYILPMFAIIFVVLFVGMVGFVVVGSDSGRGVSNRGVNSETIGDRIVSFFSSDDSKDRARTTVGRDSILSKESSLYDSEDDSKDEEVSVVGGNSSIQRVYNFRGNGNRLDWRERGRKYRLSGDERGVIAVVIDDVGIKRKSDLRAIALSYPITVSLLPYSRYALSLSSKALERGHDVFVHLPMESDNVDADPGRMALFRDLSDDDIVARTLWNLTRFDGVVGVNNHMGSRFTKWRHGMRVFLKELKSYDLLFLDSMTHPDSRGWKVAREEGIPYMIRDVFIDHDPDVEQIRIQLQQVESMASREGYAIAIGHSFHETIAMLEDWMPDASKRGFVFVPLTTIMVAMTEGYLVAK